MVLIHVTAALPLGLGIAQRRMGGGSLSLAFFFVLSVVMNGGLTEVLAMYGSENGDFRPWWYMAGGRSRPGRWGHYYRPPPPTTRRG